MFTQTPCSSVSDVLFEMSSESFKHTENVLYYEEIKAVAPNTANVDPL